MNEKNNINKSNINIIKEYNRRSKVINYIKNFNQTYS